MKQEKLEKYLTLRHKHCPLCKSHVRRKKCLECKRAVCIICIRTTAKDLGGPLCKECDPIRYR